MGAFDVGSVAREEDANVHLVGVLFEPIEETFDAVPGFTVPVLIFVFRLVGFFAVDDEVLLCLVKFAERNFGGNLEAFTGTFEVLFTFAVNVSFEGANEPVADRGIGIRNREAIVDFDNASESTAFGTSSNGGVE